MDDGLVYRHAIYDIYVQYHVYKSPGFSACLFGKWYPASHVGISRRNKWVLRTSWWLPLKNDKRHTAYKEAIFVNPERFAA